MISEWSKKVEVDGYLPMSTCGLLVGACTTCSMHVDPCKCRKNFLHCSFFGFWTSGTYFAHIWSTCTTCGPHVDLVSVESHLFSSSSILEHALIMNKLKSIPNIHYFSKKYPETLFHIFHELSIQNMISYKTYPKCIISNKITSKTFIFSPF